MILNRFIKVSLEKWVALCFIIFIWAWPRIPFQDYPAWIYESAIIARWFQGHLPHAYRIASVMPPNSLAQFVVGFLSIFLWPDIAGRIYLTAYALLMSLSIGYLLDNREENNSSAELIRVGVRQRCGDPNPATGGRSNLNPTDLRTKIVFPSFFLMSYPIFHGFLNYIMSLPILLFGIGYLRRHPYAEGFKGGLIIFVMSILSYLAHGTALGIWVLFLLIHLRFHYTPALRNKVMLGIGVVTIWAVVYVNARLHEGMTVEPFHGGVVATVAYRIRSLFRFSSLFHGFTPLFDIREFVPWFILAGVINIAFTLVVTGVCVMWCCKAFRFGTSFDKTLAATAAVLTTLFIVLPQEVGNMLNPAERLVIPAIVIAAASTIATSVQPHTRLRLWNGAAITLLASQVVYVAVFGTIAAQKASHMEHVFRTYSRTSRVSALSEMHFNLDVKACYARIPITRHQVLAMQHFFVALERNEWTPTFNTGLLRFHKPSPTLSNEPSEARLDSRLSDVVMITGDRCRLKALIRAFQPVYQLISQQSGFVVLRRTTSSSF